MELTHLLVLGVLTVLGKQALALCPAAYTDLGTGCYRFSIQEQLTWDQAYFICSLELNGYLAEIGSDQEQNNIAAYVKAVVDPAAQYVWWIGATDVLTEGTYRWMTSGDVVTFTAWANGEPNNRAGENCANMLQDSFLWNDENCESSIINAKILRAVCETDSIE